MFLVVIILLNLLIAMMNNTYSNVERAADLRWCVERTKLMGSYEGGLHVGAMQKLRHKYAIPLNADTELGSMDLSINFGLDIEFHEPNWKFQRTARNTARCDTDSDTSTSDTSTVKTKSWQTDSFAQPFKRRASQAPLGFGGPTPDGACHDGEAPPSPSEISLDPSTPLCTDAGQGCP